MLRLMILNRSSLHYWLPLFLGILFNIAVNFIVMQCYTFTLSVVMPTSLSLFFEALHIVFVCICLKTVPIFILAFASFWLLCDISFALGSHCPRFCNYCFRIWGLLTSPSAYCAVLCRYSSSNNQTC